MLRILEIHHRVTVPGVAPDPCKTDSVVALVVIPAGVVVARDEGGQVAPVVVTVASLGAEDKQNGDKKSGDEILFQTAHPFALML